MSTPPPERAADLSWRGWSLTCGLVLLLLIGTLIPLPGVDHEALRSMESSPLLGMFRIFSVSVPVVSIINFQYTSIIWLVLIRGVLVAVKNSVVRYAGTALFLSIAALQGYAVAMWLEGMPVGVDTIGLAVRLRIALIHAGGAAVVWWAASMISARGVGRGPLVLFGASLLMSELHKISVSASVSEFSFANLVAIGLWPFLVAAPSIIVALYLRWRSPLVWPVPLWKSWSLSSPVDALVLPHVVCIFPSALHLLLLAAPGPTSALFEVASWASYASTIAAAIALVAFLSRTQRAPKRGGWAYLAFAGATPLAIAGLVALGCHLGGATERPTLSSRYEGDQTVQVVLTARGEDSRARRDSEIILARLEALGIDAEVLHVEPREIRLELADVAEPESAIAQVTVRGKLELVLEASDEGMSVLTENPEVELHEEHIGDELHRYFTSRDRTTLVQFLETSVSRPSGTVFRIECVDVEDRFRSYLLLDRPELANRDFFRAEVQIDQFTGRPMAWVELSAEAGQRFAEVTASNVQRRIAIVFDDEVLSAPVIESEIPGGFVQISMGTAAGFEEAQAGAQEIVGAIMSDVLASYWVLASITIME